MWDININCCTFWCLLALRVKTVFDAFAVINLHQDNSGPDILPLLLKALWASLPHHLPRVTSTNSSQSDTLQVKSPHSCKTNRLMLWFVSYNSLILNKVKQILIKLSLALFLNPKCEFREVGYRDMLWHRQWVWYDVIFLERYSQKTGGNGMPTKKCK